MKAHDWRTVLLEQNVGPPLIALRCRECGELEDADVFLVGIREKQIEEGAEPCRAE